MKRMQYMALAAALVVMGGVDAAQAEDHEMGGDKPHMMQHPADSNGDGFLTRDEMAARQKKNLDEMFSKADTDKDGKLSREELKAHRKNRREEWKERREERKGKMQEWRDEHKDHKALEGKGVE